jgi:ABC-type transport system involved in multi-copper enzyme maturation permease subunit
MMGQTISLIRFLLLGVLSIRLFVVVSILVFTAGLLSSFITELAIVNSDQIAAALLADLLRYSLVFLALLLITTSVAQDFEFKQFERLLTMPISRWQYIAAQFMAIATISSLLVLPVFPVVALVANIDVALYWTLALWLEILLVGVLGLVAILALEKIPQAVFFSLAVYLLAKLSGLIGQMLTESVRLSDGGAANRFADMVFNGVLHIIPRIEAFAQNDIFFEPQELSGILLSQLATVTLYTLFLLGVSLVDFYRKEFNI